MTTSQEVVIFFFIFVGNILLHYGTFDRVFSGNEFEL
nr:hypothetical protein PGBZCLRD_PGBZCLRD_CDS_0003 [Cressdnaviricota sp.]